MDANLKAEIDKFVEQLCSDLTDATQSETVTNFLKTAAKFHHYSWNNIFLIAIQAPHATQVAGYKRWLELNRYVRRGEHGIAILAPVIKTVEEDGKKYQKVVNFKTTYVFDISQTDGEPLPEPPNWSDPTVSVHLQSALFSVCEDLSIKIEVTDLTSSGAKGISKGKKIVLDATAGTRVLIHELAHELLHKEKGWAMERKTKEVEAESVAFVVATHFLGETSYSGNYLALHGATPKDVRSSFEIIRSAADKIISLVEAKYDQLSLA